MVNYPPPALDLDLVRELAEHSRPSFDQLLTLQEQARALLLALDRLASRVTCLVCALPVREPACCAGCAQRAA